MQRQGVGFCLRLRCHEYLQTDDTTWIQLQKLHLQPGSALFFESVKVTKLHQLDGFNVVAYWKRTRSCITTKESWFLLTHFPSIKAATYAYQKRMGIEQMLRDHKRGGYHLEGTGLKGKRLISLLLILSIVYGAATILGKKLQHKHCTNYVARPHHSPHKSPRHSHFYVGLYAMAWLQFESSCADLITALLRLTPAKRPFYLRGQRAMSLIRATL